MIPNDWGLIPVNGNKQPIETGWPDTTYQLKTLPKSDAIGVVCGPKSGGLLMVDVDGYSAERLYYKYAGTEQRPKTITVTSGKPGRFQMAMRVGREHWERCRTRKLRAGDGEQLEFRWAGSQSVIQGVHPETGSYQWILSPDDVGIMEAPPWVVRLITEPIPEIKYEVDGLTQVIDIIRARELLARIQPADDYDTWLRVGMALRAVSDDLFEDWVRWSAEASNVCDTEQEYRYKWESFNGTGVSIGTLAYLASEGLPSDDVKDLGNWVYVANEDIYYYLPDLSVKYKKSGFDGLIGPVPTQSPKGVKFVKASKVLPQLNNLSHAVWEPGRDRLFYTGALRVLNIHSPYKKGESGSPQPMVKHIQWAYPEECEVIFDWMAYTLQRPEDKVNFALYIVGKEGTGKNLMFEPLRWAMGSEFSLVDASVLTGVFNGFLIKSKLVIVEEPKNSNDSRWHSAETLKPLLATSSPDQMIQIKEKYGAERWQKNLANVAILTNHADAIRITNGRRFYACYDSKDPQPPEYYEELADWLWTQNGASAFVHWLHNRDLAAFKPKSLPPASKSRRLIEQESSTLLNDELADYVERYQAVPFSYCKALAQTHHPRISDQGVRRCIEEVGMILEPKAQGNRRITINGSQKRVTVVRVPGLDPGQAYAALKTYVDTNDRFPPYAYDAFL